MLDFKQRSVHNVYIEAYLYITDSSYTDKHLAGLESLFQSIEERLKTYCDTRAE